MCNTHSTSLSLTAPINPNLTQSCDLKNLNLMSGFDRVLNQTGIQVLLFPSNSGHLIANEIAYHNMTYTFFIPASQNCLSTLTYLSEDDCFEYNRQHIFLCIFIYIILYMLAILLPVVLSIHPSSENNMLKILHFFDGGSICQAAVVCPPTVTVIHIHTSIRPCLNMWHYMLPDLIRYPAQSYDQVRKWIGAYMFFSVEVALIRVQHREQNKSSCENSGTHLRNDNAPFQKCKCDENVDCNVMFS